MLPGVETNSLQLSPGLDVAVLSLTPTRNSELGQHCERDPSDTARILARFLPLADAAARNGDRDGAIAALNAMMACLDALLEPYGDRRASPDRIASHGLHLVSSVSHV